jgi:hypothetical protein
MLFWSRQSTIPPPPKEKKKTTDKKTEIVHFLFCCNPWSLSLHVSLHVFARKSQLWTFLWTYRKRFRYACNVSENYQRCLYEDYHQSCQHLINTCLNSPRYRCSWTTPVQPKLSNRNDNVSLQDSGGGHWRKASSATRTHNFVYWIIDLEPVKEGTNIND